MFISHSFIWPFVCVFINLQQLRLPFIFSCSQNCNCFLRKWRKIVSIHLAVDCFKMQWQRINLNHLSECVELVVECAEEEKTKNENLIFSRLLHLQTHHNFHSLHLLSICVSLALFFHFSSHIFDKHNQKCAAWHHLPRRPSSKMLKCFVASDSFGSRLTISYVITFASTSMSSHFRRRFYRIEENVDAQRRKLFSLCHFFLYPLPSD